MSLTSQLCSENFNVLNNSNDSFSQAYNETGWSEIEIGETRFWPSFVSLWQNLWRINTSPSQTAKSASIVQAFRQTICEFLLLTPNPSSCINISSFQLTQLTSFFSAKLWLCQSIPIAQRVVTKVKLPEVNWCWIPTGSDGILWEKGIIRLWEP